MDKRAEYVIITNHGDQDQDLTDWLLRSERGNQDCYLYGSIGSGESLTIWAMSEDINQEGFNCGFGTNIWNNSKSTNVHEAMRTEMTGGVGIVKTTEKKAVKTTIKKRLLP